MIGLQKNDICYSTTRGWDGTAAGNPFNTDGVERDELDFDLARSAIDFDIIKKQSYDAEGRTIPKHYHLVRTDDNEFIPSSAIGEQFTPIQHRDVFDFVIQDVMPEIPELKLELCGTLHGGGTGLLAATFGEAFKFDGDESDNYIRLFISNPSNGSGRMIIGFTTVRVRCQNTLVAATREAKQDGFRVTHTRSAPEVTRKFVAQIRKEVTAAIKLREMCENLSHVGVDVETFRECLDSVYPLDNIPEGSLRYKMLEKARNEAIEQFENGDTAQSMSKKTMWTAFNSFTYPIFNPQRLRKSTDRAQIAYKGMTGDVGDKVRYIFNRVYSIAREVS